jgi:hypothetical protein
MKILFVLAAMVANITFANDNQEVAQEAAPTVKKLLVQEGQEAQDAEVAQEDAQEVQE